MSSLLRSTIKVWFMVFDTTFNNISVLLMEETEVPGENHCHDKLYHMDDGVLHNKT
jgi:hypothetical protein